MATPEQLDCGHARQRSSGRARGEMGTLSRCLREASHELVVLEFEAKGISKTVKAGPSVFVEGRPLSPLMFHATKVDLKKMLQHLMDRLDELS